MREVFKMKLNEYKLARKQTSFVQSKRKISQEC